MKTTINLSNRVHPQTFLQECRKTVLASVPNLYTKDLPGYHPLLQHAAGVMDCLDRSGWKPEFIQELKSYENILVLSHAKSGSCSIIWYNGDFEEISQKCGQLAIQMAQTVKERELEQLSKSKHKQNMSRLNATIHEILFEGRISPEELEEKCRTFIREEVIESVSRS